MCRVSVFLKMRHRSMMTCTLMMFITLVIPVEVVWANSPIDAVFWEIDSLATNAYALTLGMLGKVLVFLLFGSVWSYTS